MVDDFVSSARKTAGRVAFCGALALAWAVGISGPQASADELPKLETNQNFVETFTRPTTLKIDDLPSVFDFVFSSLPEKVTVYPSENYYYFSFVHQGLTYVGNLRLDVVDRDKGKVHFAYFRQYTMWQRGEDPTYKLLGPDDGVTVKKEGELAYSIASKGKRVLFELVDLSHVKPPASALTANDRYIGPVLDESGIQFYLIFNERLKIFHYVLNEEVPVGETFFEAIVSERIHIGSRTGFAYYDDKLAKRKILIGVSDANSSVNNYYDGPFDQLPDNFIKGDELETAILAVEPEMKGRMDRLGNAPDGASRFYIGPYMHYGDETELATVEECINDPEMTDETYHNCFVIEPDDSEYDGEDESDGENQTDGEAPAKN